MPSTDGGMISIILQGYAAFWPATLMLILGLVGSAVVALRAMLRGNVPVKELVDYRQLKRPDRR